MVSVVQSRRLGRTGFIALVLFSTDRQSGSLAIHRTVIPGYRRHAELHWCLLVIGVMARFVPVDHRAKLLLGDHLDRFPVSVGEQLESAGRGLSGACPGSDEHHATMLVTPTSVQRHAASPPSGRVKRLRADSGRAGEDSINACAQVTPLLFVPLGRNVHHCAQVDRFATPTPLSERSTPLATMCCRSQTHRGRSLNASRKCTRGTGVRVDQARHEASAMFIARTGRRTRSMESGLSGVHHEANESSRRVKRGQCPSPKPDWSALPRPSLTLAMQTPQIDANTPAKGVVIHGEPTTIRNPAYRGLRAHVVRTLHVGGGTPIYPRSLTSSYPPCSPTTKSTARRGGRFAVPQPTIQHQSPGV